MLSLFWRCCWNTQPCPHRASYCCYGLRSQNFLLQDGVVSHIPNQFLNSKFSFPWLPTKFRDPNLLCWRDGFIHFHVYLCDSKHHRLGRNLNSTHQSYLLHAYNRYASLGVNPPYFKNNTILLERVYYLVLSNFFNIIFIIFFNAIIFQLLTIKLKGPLQKTSDMCMCQVYLPFTEMK